MRFAKRPEADENTQRKNFTPSEAVAVAAALKPLEEKAARYRKSEGGRSGGKASGNLPGASVGDTRDKIAAAVGLSGRTLKAEVVAKRPMLTILQARTRLAKGDTTMRKLIQHGEVRAARIAGVWRIDLDDLEAYIEGQKTKVSGAAVRRPMPADEALTDAERTFL